MSRKWIMRLALTAVALLVTTDRRRRAEPPKPPKPVDEPGDDK
ncbi:hypothetical protein [Hymenobacter sp. CRA2]|nr:hypothetical protein [Hymenobacter sp. CRA2]